MSNNRRDGDVDVVIVGSGVAGSLLAAQVSVTFGMTVLVLEAGPDIPMADPGTWFHFVANGATVLAAPYAACYDWRSDFVASGTNLWQIEGSRIFGRGGSTLHWDGWTPRFMPEDFALHTQTGQGIDWPFSYDDLEPWYGEAERYLGVSGDSTDNNPPRSQPYPYGPAPFPISAGPFISAFEALEYSYGHLPVARYGAAAGPNGPCRTTGTCNYCPVRGRFTGDQPLDALASVGTVTLRLNAPVVKINMGSKQMAAGVTYFDKSMGETVEVQAQFVMLCNGAIEVPKLLLASASSYWTAGIGNDQDLVGRYLVANPFFSVSGTAPNPEAFQEELGFPSLCSRQFDSPGCQAAGKLFMTMDYDTPDLDIAKQMSAGQTAAQIMAATTAPASFTLYGNMSPFSQYANRVTPADGLTRFNLPKTQIDTPDELYDPATAAEYLSLMQTVLANMGCQNVASAAFPQRGDHAACTTRMATDPSQGVVGTDFRVFGTSNLFVFGNSVLPTLPAANPTLTMVAMILRFINSDASSLLRKG